MPAKGNFEKKKWKHIISHKSDPQPNRIGGQITFTHQKISFAIRDATIEAFLTISVY